MERLVSATLPLYMQTHAPLLISRLEAHPLIKHHALRVVLFGYTVIHNCFSTAYCQQVIAKFKQFEAVNPRVFEQHRCDLGYLPRVVNLHLALKALTPLFSQTTMLLAVEDLLFGKPASLYTSLFYERGSEQPLHRDTPVFCTRPEYQYFGNTVYLEPAGEENGCLEVMEGGHLAGELDREALAMQHFGSLEKVPQLDNGIWMEYQNLIVARCESLHLQKRKVNVEAGDVVIWHPQLPHGGSVITDRSRTRFSLVFHTTPVNVPVYHQDVFFQPGRPMSEVPAWSYSWTDGRAVAAHTHGIGLGDPINQDYPFSALTVLQE